MNDTKIVLAIAGGILLAIACLPLAPLILPLLLAWGSIKLGGALTESCQTREATIVGYFNERNPGRLYPTQAAADADADAAADLNRLR
jgi:hypothetical protein